ncbi:hypothetical protein MKW92_044071 [Papaver armeniacum]|nr:hypothetical protein MKW92_044071 [Papaver armeniacum]
MALKNVAKMLSRRFTSFVSKNGGIETKHSVITDDKLRSVCVRSEQITEKAKQLKDEYSAVFALKRAFPLDRVIWLAIILNLGGETGVKVQTIWKTKKYIKDQESELSAFRTRKQELQLPA